MTNNRERKKSIKVVDGNETIIEKKIVGNVGNVGIVGIVGNVGNVGIAVGSQKWKWDLLQIEKLLEIQEAEGPPLDKNLCTIEHKLPLKYRWKQLPMLMLTSNQI